MSRKGKLSIIIGGAVLLLALFLYSEYSKDQLSLEYSTSEAANCDEFNSQENGYTIRSISGGTNQVYTITVDYLNGPLRNCSGRYPEARRPGASGRAEFLGDITNISGNQITIDPCGLQSLSGYVPPRVGQTHYVAWKRVPGLCHGGGGTQPPPDDEETPAPVFYKACVVNASGTPMCQSVLSQNGATPLENDCTVNQPCDQTPLATHGECVTSTSGGKSISTCLSVPGEGPDACQACPAQLPSGCTDSDGQSGPPFAPDCSTPDKIKACPVCAAASTDGTTIDNSAGPGFQPGINVPSVGQPKDLGVAILRLFKWSLGILGISVFLVFFAAGAMWATAAGNPNTIGRAKSMMANAVIGAILLVSAYVILYSINPDLVDNSGTLPAIDDPTP